MTLVYKTNQAKSNDILSHLRICDDSFVPPLSQKVDIEIYSRKIFENADTFEAWSENELVGLVAAYYNVVNRTAFITNVSVIEKYSSRGVGSKLLEICVEHFKSLQFMEISLEVNKRSEKARSLYKKCGFHEAGLNEESILMRCEI